MKKPLLAVVALVIVLVVCATSLVASGKVSVKRTSGSLPIIETIMITGSAADTSEADTHLVDVGRIKPGIWRMSVGSDTPEADMRSYSSGSFINVPTAYLYDRNGHYCGKASPSTYVFIGRNRGSHCLAGDGYSIQLGGSHYGVSSHYFGKNTIDVPVDCDNLLPYEIGYGNHHAHCKPWVERWFPIDCEGRHKDIFKDRYGKPDINACKTSGQEQILEQFYADCKGEHKDFPECINFTIAKPKLFNEGMGIPPLISIPVRNGTRAIPREDAVTVEKVTDGNFIILFERLVK